MFIIIGVSVTNCWQRMSFVTSFGYDLSLLLILVVTTKFASVVLYHNPPLPGLPGHALPVLNHD